MINYLDDAGLAVYNSEVLKLFSGVVSKINSIEKTQASGGFDIKAVIDGIYPVGCVYSSYAPTSPADLFGGTWVELTGVFPYYNGGTSTGGSNTHTITVDELPPHTHTYDYSFLQRDQKNDGRAGARYDQSSYKTMHVYEDKETASTGSGQPMSIMPSYQTLYAWRRIS